MTDIPQYDTFAKIEPLNKGWSSDKKYYVETTDGRRLLLRVADIAEYERKRTEFDMLKRVAELDVPASRPVDFGVCDGGKSVYQLLTWIDGEDAETVLPTLSEAEQYALGVKAGEILQKIHSIPAPENIEDWAARFNRKTDTKIKKYKECGLRFDGDETIIAYLQANRRLLENRPQCYQHGDYHVGNMLIADVKALSIIDWNRDDYGDPWEEFNRIVWCAQASPHFATGQLRGYCGGEPPIEFWQLLAYYIGSNTLSSIYWAIPFGQSEIDTSMNQTKDIMQWYDNFNRIVPTWYLPDFYVQYIDGIPFKLKSPFDFSFLAKYGAVFKVFDDQDSGNICFGVTADDGKRYFVKFAGAPTAEYDGTLANAVTRLKETVTIYEDLAHPNLIKFVKSAAIGDGFAMIFEWVDAVCAQPMYPADYWAFIQLPIETKMQIFSEITEFMAYIAECGYVAIDFYDGSIMWDATNNRTVICDIDFFQKSPYVGRIGLWGSTRFISPEERTDSAVIDEVTNVYTLGATAFALFSDSDRSRVAWPLSDEQYAVVKKAISDERGQRQQSIKQLQAEWEAAR